ncbi:rho GDP-dissociation inhibitor 1-like [Helianthus annuus]|uniref:rho GDP-dissociation inhibitor 1-like n=1 Tax=Helianthus annuus TaxID=4232 RepID=UPI000B908B6D|nr:rho GDP-dissociation inhibitor 1-like [Helianthus annuus]
MGDDKNDAKDDASESGGVPSTEPSESSFYATDEDEEAHIELGPKMSIREHLEKDKDDESLRRWKEQLLGGVDVNEVAEVVKTRGGKMGGLGRFGLWARMGMG